MMKELSVQSIDKKLKEVSYNELPNFLEEISGDSRIGVQKLIKNMKKSIRLSIRIRGLKK